VIVMSIMVRRSSPKPLEVRARSFDLKASRRRIALGMLAFWRSGMRRGVMADGQALALNKRGGLLGIGAGSIVDGWSATELNDGVQVKPYTVGKYLAALRKLIKRGVVYRSFAGPSGVRMAELVADESERQHAAMFGGGR
jgi:hypothetical protein